MNAKAMCVAMEAWDDFATEPVINEFVIRSRMHLCTFYPKFHCELSPIEQYWAAVKAFTRKYCGYKKAHQQIVLPLALRRVWANRERCGSGPYPFFF